MRGNPTNSFTKECIVSALLRLICEKPLSAISITELCQKAGVSRMSFYRNYNSKEEIFTEYLSEIFEEYAREDASLPSEGVFYDKAHLIHFFSSLSNYRDFFDGLIYCGFGMYFLKMMNDYLLEKWGQISDTYTLVAFSGALYNTFFLWSSDGYAMAPEELADQLVKVFRV